jgi:prepilin-type N-terminal cleavage/methylation domain-containing protein
MRKISSHQGFSLLELLIVVAIILMIATTIRSSSLLRSRQAANKSAAVSTLKNVNAAQTTYLSTNGTFGSLRNFSAGGMLDVRFTGNGSTLAGYVYSVYGGGTGDYTVSAVATGTQGRYNYYSGVDFVVRYRAAAGEILPAGVTAGDPVG